MELIEDFDANRFPMPIDVTGRDPVAIGRIRQDISDPNALDIFELLINKENNKIILLLRLIDTLIIISLSIYFYLNIFTYMYPYINFDIYDNELKWSNEKETITKLENRIEDMLDWIGTRRETRIAIVSHSSFIGQFKDKKIGDENNELRHCYPYKIEANYSSLNKFISMKEVKKNI